MFHYLSEKEYQRLQNVTLAEIYEYAKENGFAESDVEIEVTEFTDGDKEYEVSIGHPYGEYWSWDFDDITEKSTEFSFYGMGE